MARKPKDLEVPEGMKWCGYQEGHLEKVTEFGNNKGMADGLEKRCRSCQSIANKAARERRKNGTLTRESPKKRPANILDGFDWCSMSDHIVPVAEIIANKGRVTGRDSTCLTCRVNASYRSHYGISKAEFNARLEAQNMQCAVCGTNSPTGKGWAMDHDHSCCPSEKSCGQCLRSVLCSSCNLMLGFFSDGIPVIKSAIAYVNRGYVKIPELDAYVPWGNLTTRDYSLWNNYRIREVQFDYLADRYNGCMIHGGTECTNGKSLCVDHDDSHCRKLKQGCQECIRGILCDASNKAIGYANHDPEIMRSAIAYLERHSTNKETHALAA